MAKLNKGFAEIGYFTITEKEDGTDEYGPVTKFPGGREYSVAPQGDPVEIYADSVLAYSEDVNDGYMVSLTVLKYLDSVMHDWLGDTVDTAQKTRAEYDNQVRPRFGLALRDLTTDAAGEIKWFYNCRANSRPTFASKTKEKGFDAQFETMEIRASRRNDGLVMYVTQGNEIPSVVPTVAKPSPVGA